MGEIFLTERRIVELCANEPEAPEGMRTDSKLHQRFVGGRAACSDQYLFDDAAPRHQEADGTSYITGELAGCARELGGNHGRRGNTSPIQSF